MLVLVIVLVIGTYKFSAFSTDDGKNKGGMFVIVIVRVIVIEASQDMAKFQTF